MQKVLYQDKDVIISDRAITIKCYFFPFGNSKTIGYGAIKSVEMKNYAWKGKLWGMNVTEWGYWMPGDLKRWDYDRFIAIQTGSSIKPCFTCLDMDQAYEILQTQLRDFRQRNKNGEMKQLQKERLIKSE